MKTKKLRYILNVYNSIYNYKKNRVHLSSKPNLVWIEPTNICNLRCPMCPATHNKNIPHGFMSFSLFKKIVDEISDSIVDCYLFLGGEALLHKEIIKMVRYLKKKNICVLMDTNGTLLTKELAGELIAAGLDFVSFSFDGYDKKTYESIRINASFDETLNNIITLLKLKQELKKNNPYVRIRTIEDSVKKGAFSKEKKESFIRNFAGLHVEEFSAIQVGNWLGYVGQIPQYEIPPPQKIDTASPRFSPCPQLWTALSIRWNGEVSPCCIDISNSMPLGNVKEKSIMQIWNGEPIKKLREAHLKKDLSRLSACSYCGTPVAGKKLGIPVSAFSGISSALRMVLGFKLYRKISKAFHPS
ncbi:MAG: radical SAM protein [Armatimonadota bacterium]